MRYLFGIFLISYLLVACVPPNKYDNIAVVIDYANSEHRHIVDLKDRRAVDSLLIFLDSDDVTVRYLAAEAFGSIKDIKAIAPLTTLLTEDPSDEVRTQAAYALGQIGDPAAAGNLTKAFGRQDTSNYNTLLRGTILEAVGRVGDESTLNLITGISTYGPEEDELILGQLRSFYRFAQRGLEDPRATEIAISIVEDPQMPLKVRRMAADFLSRYMEDIADGNTRLLPLLREPDNDIRTGISNALAKTGDAAILPQLLGAAMHDPDYRVRTNVLRSVGVYNYLSCRDSLLVLLSDKNEHIAGLAADAIKLNGSRRDAGVLLNLGKEIQDPILKSKVLAGAINPVPLNYTNTRSLINKELVDGLAAARTPYERASFIQALALDPGNFEIFKSEGLQSLELPVLTSAIMAIGDLITNIRSQRMYRTPSSKKYFRGLILTELLTILNDGDPGAIAALATVLRDPDLEFKEDIEMIGPFRQALRKVSLPENTETQYELLSLLEFLEDTTYQKAIPRYNHPIDWEVLQEISDSSHAFIITPKGQIKIKLMPNHAPGSVSNFVALTKSNYFDGKVFHRVVPNFVIQGGCSRGDGFGGLDYTIRSELGQRYYDSPGYVGIASAGPDTEGTQFFITHTATPHLDGRYTIFAKVEEGMDVVNNIEVGDIIQDVRVVRY